MSQFKTLAQMAEHVRASGTVTRIAVAVAEDSHTLSSLGQAAREGFVQGILIGNLGHINALCEEEQIDPNLFELHDIPDEDQATAEAVRMVRSGEADALMKGLVSTDRFLKAVLHKDRGLLPPKTVMSHVCVMEVPRYHKLLFLSDTAVLPFPDLYQKIAMVKYSVAMARTFGVAKPKVALITATEKVYANIPNTLEYAQICKMAACGQINDCVVDGPLDVFLACDPSAAEVKGVQTPVEGDADILIFPNLESANSFYKGLMLFAECELAGLLQGTTKPVIVMSRSESAASKYYCIALACLMAGEK
ncbi:MAG: phosphate acetyltransferase [Candidatus Syntrophosphaera sp.]|nr:phosphate acetyltransferase [Candidatus Syntrophosphaera sp.]